MCIVLALAVLVAAFLALHAWEDRRFQLENAGQTSWAEGGRAEILYNGVSYVERNRLETVLLIGLDKFSDEVAAEAQSSRNQQQSDFLLLLIVDHKSDCYTVLHINRDTMADMRVLDINGREINTVSQQLALSHTYGSGGQDSCRNTADAVSGLLGGVTIDHFVAVTMDAVSELDDLVGGVSVTIEDDFSGIDDSLVQGETITLNGEQALHFVRARGGMEDSSNLRRMERQREYLSALRQAALDKEKEDDSFLGNALIKISDAMVSDCSLNQLSNIISSTVDYEMNGIEVLEGEAIKGELYMEFHPDEEALRQQVIRLFFEPSELSNE